MPLAPFNTRLVCVVTPTRIGLRVKVQMPNPNQPGTMMTLGVLQMNRDQWRAIKSCLTFGAAHAGVTLETPDPGESERARVLSRPLADAKRPAVEQDRSQADLAHWSTFLGHRIEPDEPFR